MQITDFVCLANSRKAGGRCVAGIRLSGDWIRPVSGETDGRLSRHHYGLQNGLEPVPLDIIRLEAAPSPELHQPENWLISDARWQRMGRLIFSDARDLLRRRATPGPGLLGNQQSWVAYEDLAEHPVQASLCIVEPADLHWSIISPANRNRRVRALFTVAGTEYDLPVTDLAWERRLDALGGGIHARDEGGISDAQDVFLTVSLAGTFGGSCYKLVAAVIPL